MLRIFNIFIYLFKILFKAIITVALFVGAVAVFLGLLVGCDRPK